MLPLTRLKKGSWLSGRNTSAAGGDGAGCAHAHSKHAAVKSAAKRMLMLSVPPELLRSERTSCG